MSYPKTIKIDNVEYVEKSSVAEKAEELDGLEYCIVRCDRSGVFAGYVKSRDGREVTILKSRRLWYWSGAASLSQLALEGVGKPNACKFPAELPEMTVLDAVEIIPATEKCKESIDGVKVWSV